MSKILHSAALACALLAGNVQAAPVDVSYTITGSANNWVYDFAFTNNVAPGFEIYFAGVQFATPGTTISSPFPVWAQPWSNMWSTNGSDNTYNTNWLDEHNQNTISLGKTKHFVVKDTSTAKLSQVNWFAFAVTQSDDDWYYLPHVGDAPWDPGFEGTATVSAVPEPETYGMLLAGLGLVTYVARRKAKSAA